MLKYPEVDEQYKTRAVEDSVFLRLASLFYRHTSRARHSCTHDRAVRAIVRPGGSRMRTRVRAGRIISVQHAWPAIGSTLSRTKLMAYRNGTEELMKSLRIPFRYIVR